MKFRFVHRQINSCSKSLITVITWNRYSLQVICLDMVNYICDFVLFSTHFANESSFLLGCPICLFFIQNHVLAFLHHRLDLLVQCLHNAAELVGDNNDLGSLFCIINVLCWWFLKSFFGFVNWLWISTLFFSSLEVWPASPLSLSSSAITRKESRFSW